MGTHIFVHAVCPLKSAYGFVFLRICCGYEIITIMYRRVLPTTQLLKQLIATLEAGRCKL